MFKKNDIITGSKERYSITNMESLLKVVRVPSSRGTLMRVRLLEHQDKDYISLIGQEYEVDSTYFKKISKIERVLRFNK